jgi:hypothetical protein
MTLERPKCACGKEMQVIYYTGYYDSFKYWDFHKECKCPNTTEVEDIEPDYEWKGSY